MSHSSDRKKASCQNCGFSYSFKKHGKKATKPTWRSDWYCEDAYDRAWRLKDYDRHEVVGTRKIGKRRFYMIGCPKSGSMFQVAFQPPPDEIFCGDCDRTGMFGPMLVRHRERRET